MNPIRKAAVFGAGVMGSGIAAHIANAGVPVMLFDIASPTNSDRRAIAAAAIARLTTTEPAPLMHKRNAELITACSVGDDMEQIGQCDWIIEAISEHAEAKKALYRKIDESRRQGSVVSSNTSTIPLRVLIDGLPDGLARDFLITHFFNPPRYQRLLEVVPGPKTNPETINRIENFADLRLGKTPIRCKDTPGFIANRIGIYWLQCAIAQALELGLTVEEADAVLGVPIGGPKTGVFGLLDMVGIDLMPPIIESMATALAKEDPFHATPRDLALINSMISSGHIGRKGKGGFYRLKPSSVEKHKESLDLTTGRYRPSRRAALDSVGKSRRGGLRALLEHPDKGGRYAWWVMSRTLSYAAELVPEIADNILSIDEAMRLGYNWKRGPFQMIDQLGVDWFVRELSKSGMRVPLLLERAKGRQFYCVSNGQLQYLTIRDVYANVVRRDGVLLLEDIKRAKPPVKRGWSASIWDIGDGVLCLEFHSKMNSLNPLSLMMIDKAIRITSAKYRALVIYNEGSNFSVGANIGILLIIMKLRAWFSARVVLRYGQRVLQRLKHARFPVVAAPAGMALGGGCEVLLHSSAVQAAAETYIGLVETGVGLVPGWGGCKELLIRRVTSKESPNGPMPPVIKAFETIGMASVATSAEQAKELLFMRASDGITMNRDRLLADAKARALSMSSNYIPPVSLRISLPGRTAFAALSLALTSLRKGGKATAHDLIVGKELARVVTGGDTDITESLSEDDVLSLERRTFLALAKQPASMARVRHMLATGKPLRN
jgi:3-hydroxyacyl-CoA dehydrogenase